MKTKIQIESNNGELLYFVNVNEKEFIITTDPAEIGGSRKFYFPKEKLQFIIKELQFIEFQMT